MSGEIDIWTIDDGPVPILSRAVQGRASEEVLLKVSEPENGFVRMSRRQASFVAYAILQHLKEIP